MIAVQPELRALLQREDRRKSPATYDLEGGGPAATLGVEYDEKAARQVVRESAGYPYFIQEYGLELWNHAATPTP